MRISILLLALMPGWAGTVSIAPKGDGFELLRDGKPYYILGAGGTARMEMLKQSGLYADSPGGYAQVLRLMRYRAARVTVDVKMHTWEWTFDQGVEYFMK